MAVVDEHATPPRVIHLPEDVIPTRWHNVAVDLPFELPPHLDPIVEGSNRTDAAGSVEPDEIIGRVSLLCGSGSSGVRGAIRVENEYVR